MCRMKMLVNIGYRVVLFVVEASAVGSGQQSRLKMNNAYMYINTTGFHVSLTQ